MRAPATSLFHFKALAPAASAASVWRFEERNAKDVGDTIDQNWEILVQCLAMALRKYENHPIRKSNQGFGTNTVQQGCSQRNDKLVAHLNWLQLAAELTWTRFAKAKVGREILPIPKMYECMGLRCKLKAPGACEEKLSALEAFVPPTHFVEWVGEPD